MKSLVSMIISGLALLVLSLAPGSNIYGATPAPMLKQLNIGHYTYSGSAIWVGSQSWSRNWYANRYSFLLGSDYNSASVMAEMRTVNPGLKGLVYQLYVRYAEDTVNVKNWCNTMGYDFDSMVVRAPTTDSMQGRSSPYNDAFGRYIVTPPGEIFRHGGFTSSQTRFAWDFRNPKVGEYLAYTWMQSVASFGYNGTMVDEEFTIGYTNNAVVGNFPIIAPFRDNTSEYWDRSWGFDAPYDWANGWTKDFDLQGPDADANTTHSYVDIRDSLRRARAGWMQTAGNIMKSNNYFYAPNFAAVPTSNYGNWDNEGRQAAIYCGAYIIGEYSYFYPGTGTHYANCANLVRACHSVKDENVDMFVGWIRMGQFDRFSGIDYARSKMNGLGLMLASLFPGTARYWFSPCVKNGQVDFMTDVSYRNLGGYLASDTLTLWSYAWGKYFGVPTSVRDSSLTGTDGAGQSYKVWQFALLDPANSVDTQTFVVGRIGNGTNFDLAATSINVSLPAGSWYELRDIGVNTSSEGTVIWEQLASNTVTIGNSEFRFFVKDTTLANNGWNDSIPPSKIRDLGFVPGNSHGEITLTWTAPGDDGSAGRADHYEIMWSSDSITADNWSANQSLSSPKPSGSTETYTITGLAEGEKYYTGVVALDEAGNRSLLSNYCPSYANGIKAPDIRLTEVSQTAGSATFTCSVIESYYSPIEFRLRQIDQRTLDTTVTLSPISGN